MLAKALVTPRVYRGLGVWVSGVCLGLPDPYIKPTAFRVPTSDFSI